MATKRSAKVAAKRKAVPSKRGKREAKPVSASTAPAKAAAAAAVAADAATPSFAPPPSGARVVSAEPVPNPTPPTAGHTLQHAHSFPIIGVGASAGGLEALELFLGRVPAKCGAAFVVVQHLDPTHKGMLVELL